MRLQARLAKLIPDQPPTWPEVLIPTVFFVLYGTELVFDVLTGSVTSWPGVIAGVVLSVCLAIGMTSSLGTRLGRWYENKPVVSRILVVIALVLIPVSAPLWAPKAPFLTTAKTFVTVCFFYMIAILISKQEVSGWNRNQSTTD